MLFVFQNQFTKMIIMMNRLILRSMIDILTDKKGDGQKGRWREANIRIVLLIIDFSLYWTQKHAALAHIVKVKGMDILYLPQAEVNRGLFVHPRSVYKTNEE